MPEPGRSAAAGRGGAEIAEREKIRTALRLAEVAWRDFDRRRAYEWKVNFALWPALGALSGFFWKGSQNLDAFPAVSISILLMIIGCIYWFKWSVGLWERNKFDQDTAQYYWARADGDPSSSRPLPRTQPGEKSWTNAWNDGWRVLGRWSHGSQIIITLILIAIAIGGALHPLLHSK